MIDYTPMRNKFFFTPFVWSLGVKYLTHCRSKVDIFILVKSQGPKCTRLAFNDDTVHYVIVNLLTNNCCNRLGRPQYNCSKQGSSTKQYKDSKKHWLEIEIKSTD